MPMPLTALMPLFYGQSSLKAQHVKYPKVAVAQRKRVRIVDKPRHIGAGLSPIAHEAFLVKEDALDLARAAVVHATDLRELAANLAH